MFQKVPLQMIKALAVNPPGEWRDQVVKVGQNQEAGALEVESNEFSRVFEVISKRSVMFYKI